MLDIINIATSFVITGLTQWFVRLCVKKGMKEFYAPVLASFFAGLVAVIWFAFFEPSVSWKESLKAGFFLGALNYGLISPFFKIQRYDDNFKEL